jgi:hypothetical protein
MTNDSGEPKPSEHPLIKVVGWVTQFAAVAIALVYGAGFIIVTFYQARLGISDFNVLRPKIIMAGIAFWILLLLPLGIAFRWFDAFGFSSSRPVGEHRFWETPTQRHKTGLRVLRIGVFIVLASSFAPGFRLLLFASQAQPRSTFISVSLFAGVVVCLVWGKNAFAKSPLLFSGLVILLCVAAFVAEATYGNLTIFFIACWFVLVPALVGWFSFMLKGETWRSIEFETQLPIVLGVLLFYSAALYPRLRPQFGGGQPFNVVVFLAEQSPIGASGSQIAAQLIEQTAEGYYLRPTGSESVYFIPRSSVGTVRFVR